MTFDPNKPVQTRDGRKARIICTDRKSNTYPIIALVDNGYAGEEYSSFTKNGVFNTDGGRPESDLINVSEKRECWINLYRTLAGNLYAGDIFTSKIEADYAGSGRISCIHHEWSE